MKRFFNKYVVTGFLVLVTGYGLGPRVKLDETIKPATLPNDLDAYIRTGENQVANLKPGTDKVIIWADPDQRQPTPYSIVYLHGFSASRQEIAPVCDNIARTLGANLFYSRLTGHGADNRAMANLSVNALLNDAVEALEIGKRLGDKVIVIGTSTGGTLATWLASYDKASRIAALVLLSPNYGPKRKESEFLLLPWGSTILHFVEGPVYKFEPYNELQQQYWTTQYPSEALLSMMGIVKVTRDKDPTSIHTPVLVMYSPNDTIIDTQAVQAMYSQFASEIKKIIAVTDSGDPQQHILAGDILSPQTTQAVTNNIVEFIRRLP
ncbi:alpha/beta hydrolase [Kaarinaea lacus]